MLRRLLFRQSVRTLSGIFRPEIELLLCCARTHIDPETNARIKSLLRESLDWDYLIRKALQCKVMPLLYWNLNVSYSEDIPQDRLDQLRGYFQANAQRNLVQTRGLLKLLDLFEAHTIPAIPYKGPVLAAHIYGNLALRQFNDLDILISQSDLLKAKELLLSQGYRLLAEMNGGSAESSRPSSAYNLKFIRNDSRIELLELHWQVAPPYFSFPELESFWQRLVPVSLVGRTVLGPSVEDLLLILCIHGSKDEWRRLSWLCDVAELIRLYHDLNWDYITAWAARLRGERMLYLGLAMASDLLETDLPEEIRLKIKADPMVKLLARQMYERLFAENISPLSGIGKHVYYLKLREKWRDKMTYFLFQARLKVAPNVKDQALVQLPSMLSFFYYPLRPIRLIKQYGLTVLKEFYRF